MKKYKVFIGIVVLIFALSACGRSTDKEEKENSKWDEIKEEGVLVVGTSGTLIAASYYDGDEENDDQLTGFDVEVMKEIGNRLDIDIEFEVMGIDGMLPAIKSGRIDVAANDIEVTENRQKEFNFSEPYKYSYTTMAVRESDNSEIETLEDLKGKKAGGGATTIYSQIAEQFGAEIITYGNAPNEAYLRDVSDGETDVVINDYYLTKFGVSAFPDFDLHLHPTLKFHPTETAVVMEKDAEELTIKINEVLNDMRIDGTLSTLAKEFYTEDASEQPEGDIEIIEGLDL